MRGRGESMQGRGGACSCVRNACMHVHSSVCVCLSLSVFMHVSATEALNVVCVYVCVCGN